VDRRHSQSFERWRSNCRCSQNRTALERKRRRGFGSHTHRVLRSRQNERVIRPDSSLPPSAIVTCSHVGPTALTARDCALPLDRMAGSDACDPHSPSATCERYLAASERAIESLHGGVRCGTWATRWSTRRWSRSPSAWLQCHSGSAANARRDCTSDGVPVGLEIVRGWRADVPVVVARAVFDSTRPWPGERSPFVEHSCEDEVMSLNCDSGAQRLAGEKSMYVSKTKPRS
jgi:hypothetical protein